jgi:flagellar biosynthesis/type III secretory pathway protein FliH
MYKPNIDNVADELGDLNLSSLEMQSIFRVVKDNFDQGYEQGYEKGKEAGYEDGVSDTEEDLPNEEQIGVEYAYEAFNEIETLEDFKDKLREIDNRRMNFMQPLGI